ncbi:hypothetical protein ABIA39_008920 [Nocardia sp. GAS34]|uniref:hypothetical protein n=1 Tax=unclassified Nocardia TaxID=2637762 RepID=UPI003D1FA653
MMAQPGDVSTAMQWRRPTDPLLPSSDVVLCLLRGQLDATDAIAELIQRLGCLYRELITIGAGEGDRVRAEIGATRVEIDRSVAGRLPRPRPGAFRVMHSVGRALSLLVEAWEFAWWALMHDPTDDLQVLRSWDYLAEMVNGYGEFTERVFAGGIELPTAWPGIEREVRCDDLYLW